MPGAKAAELRRLRREGGDVIEHHRKARQKSETPTFETVARKVHAAIAPTFKNRKHAAQWLTSLETYAFEHIGSLPVDRIRQADVLRVLSPIWTTKEETAGRVHQRIAKVLDWAKSHGYRSGDNPCDYVKEGLPRQKGKAKRVKHHEALPFAKVPEFLVALNNSTAGQSARLGLEFVILTAARVSEVRFAERSEFDLEEKLWTVPAERMKSGREHVVPLSDRALAIVKAAMAANPDGDLIFPSDHRSGRALTENVFTSLAQSLGFGAVTAHGFRSSFRDFCAEKTSFSREVAEASLAHVVKDATEAAYFRTTMLPKRRALLSAWASFATAPPKQGETVVRLERATAT